MMDVLTKSSDVNVGLISNSLSRGNRRALPSFRPSHDSNVKMLHRPIEGRAGLEKAIDDFAQAKVEVIAINGGDGTVSAVLTQLFAHTGFDRQPALALLRGGTLNMCADDVGLPGRAQDALKRLVEFLAGGGLTAASEERHVIRLTHSNQDEPIYGMFFATSALYRATEFCYEKLQARGINPSLAMAMTLIYLLARKTWRGGRNDPVLHPDQLRVRLDGGEAEAEELQLALTTTLNRLSLGWRPYWGEGPGGLRYTAIRYPPRRLVRYAYRILYGAPDRHLPPETYISRNLDSIVIEPASPFSLDGELYRPDPAFPLTLRDGGRVRFLCC